MKLWNKGYTLDSLIEAFTVGKDPELDLKLVPYDCMGSIAHAKGLHKIGILNDEELEELITGLQNVIALWEKGEFTIAQSDEDVHTAVENALGEVGKKLHAARSRNDQVLTDLRLWTKDQLYLLFQLMQEWIDALYVFASVHQEVPIPGRTHMQPAMPSSLGLWAGAYAECFFDNLTLAKGAYELNDQCPLGSAASYGASIPLDRQYTSDLLGFSKVQNNVLWVNNSRGKIESIVVHALAQIMNDLSKFATDLIFFSLPEVGYVSLPKELCSGSSLMPQKHNPCGLELMRAKAATVQGYLIQILEIIRALPSGYNRDFQETKAPLMYAFEQTLASIAVAKKTLQGIKVHCEKCISAFTPELFATDSVLNEVKKGVPFRDAYKKIAMDLSQIQVEDPVENIKSKTHLGAPGNLRIKNEKITNF